MKYSSGSGMQELWDSSQLNGGSAAWLEALYENYSRNPDQIETQWRNFFDGLPKVKSGNGNGGHVVLMQSQMMSKMLLLKRRNSWI